MKIFIPGGAGLVGLNLIYILSKNHPNWEILVVDKKQSSILIGKKLFKNVNFLCEDLTLKKGNKWHSLIKDFDICIMLQAEIGNKDTTQFERNNVLSTEVILKEIKKTTINKIIHVSSSVLNSVYNDSYTETKLLQEKIILKKWNKKLVILRPTLMFGFFDRKHLGWIQKFMKRFPVFPIPGNGNFIRQPLFVLDFCKIIESCILNLSLEGIFDITGLQKVPYKKLMKIIRNNIKNKPLFVYIPIPIFGILLEIWGLISHKPAFTKTQLQALTAGDEFEVINWPEIFSLRPTNIEKAIYLTYNHHLYSQVELPF